MQVLKVLTTGMAKPRFFYYTFLNKMFILGKFFLSTEKAFTQKTESCSAQLLATSYTFQSQELLAEESGFAYLSKEHITQFTKENPLQLLQQMVDSFTVSSTNYCYH